MALYALFALIAFGCLRALSNWRNAWLVVVTIAAVQDPLRKLVPGVPGYLVLATAPVIFAMLFALISRQRSWWRIFARSFPHVDQATRIFMIACVPAAMISATYGPGSWLLTLLGAYSYALIVLAVVLGFHFPRRERELRQMLGFYCLLSSAMLTGGVIEYLNLWSGSPILGTSMLEMDWVRYRQGYTVNLIAGFYRSPDVMGWHAAAVAMLALMLGMTARGGARWRWLGVTAFAVLALLICGRRKMVYMLPAFIMVATWLYWQSGRTTRLVTIIGVLLIPLASVYAASKWLGDDSAQVQYYKTDVDETVGRVQQDAWLSLVETYRQAGFFGSGLGVATPGSHHLSVARPRVWQESGPSRVLVELGVPGMLALVALLGSLFFAAWHVALRHLRARSPMADYATGLLAFFVANIGSLVVSGQILADSFIATFIGFSLGLVLAFARVPLPEPAAAAAAQSALTIRPQGPR